MIKHRLHTLIIAFMLAIPAAWSAVGVNEWETVKTEIRDSKPVVKEQEIEISISPGYIIVNTGKVINIKVFTILGRVISEETLSPGTSRLPITAHGVYIVKVGELTCKIAL